MSELFRCDNCGHEADYDEMEPALGLSRRFEVGDIYSDVECPECGALCFPVPTKQEQEAEERQKLANALLHEIAESSDLSEDEGFDLDEALAMVKDWVRKARELVRDKLPS